MLLAAGLVVLTLISATSVYLVNKAREDARWVLHSMEVENEISLAQLQMRRAESAQRGFLLTQRPEFRSAFEEAASQIAPSFERLGALTIDNPYQQQRLQTDDPADQSADRAVAATASISRWRTGRTKPPRSRARRPAATPWDIFVVSRARCGPRKSACLRRERRRPMRSQSLSASITSIGSGLVVVFAGLSIFLVRRSSRARDVAEAQLLDNNLNLESIVENAPATCARPTRKSSASPISSATICARRWSTSWASPASLRNCAATSSSGSRP